MRWAQVGKKNLITDVPGLLVGNATDSSLKSGVTVLFSERPFACAVDVMGGAPGTRETDLLEPDRLVQAVDALVLSGGSAFGLDAASGVANELARRGRGYVVGSAKVPLVPAAILFDLLNGGDKGWETNPYSELGCLALGDVADQFELGSQGAGCGATTANLKGGLGSASLLLENDVTVGALVAANPLGSVVDPVSGQFLAAPFEIDGEFGGRGVPSAPDPFYLPVSSVGVGEKTDSGALHSGGNTSLVIVGTDAALGKADLKRLAVAAQDGLARAVLPSHTPFDGDLVFSVSTGDKSIANVGAGIDAQAGGPAPSHHSDRRSLDPQGLLQLGHAAALCVSRAMARAVFEASAEPGDLLPVWNGYSWPRSKQARE